MIRNILFAFLVICISQSAFADKAFDDALKKAKAGDAADQHNLGLLYDKGQGVTQNYKKAAAWYLKAAKKGYAKSQSNLGNMYSLGQGVKQDYKEAHTWFLKAAEQGYAKAQYNL